MEQKQETLVFYASPGIGHLKPMVEFANLILTKYPSLSITILLTCLPGMPESTFDPLIASAATPSIAFRFLPCPLTRDSASGYSFMELSYEIPRLSCPEVRLVLEGISGGSRVIRAFVIDFFCNAAFEVSTSLGIGTYFFRSSGGASLAGLLYLPEVIRVVGPSRDPDTLVRVPGLPPFPFSVFKKHCTEGTVGKLFLSTAVNMARSRGIIVRTVRELEEGTLRAISGGLCTPKGPNPPVYCIGHLVGKIEKIEKEEFDCLSWLDSQPSKSVIFLCFGRMGVFSGKKIKEMAVGLDKSGHRFLWVVRDPPPGGEDGEDLFPPGFLDRTQGRGLVVKNWAPQKAVLSHGSIGGFVTHCGWNSVLEAVCLGVPMVTWPLYAEQEFNREGMVGEMKVALRLNESKQDGFVSAIELEKRVNELMDSDSARGREVRERVSVMKEFAMASMAEGGSSQLELTQFIESLK